MKNYRKPKIPGLGYIILFSTESREAMQRKGFRRTDVHRIVMYIDDSIINRVCLNREERVLGSLPFSFGQLCTYFRTHTQVPRQSSPNTVGPPSDPFGRTHLRTPCEASPYEGCKILDVFQRLSDPLRTLSDPPSDPLRSESLLGVQDFRLSDPITRLDL